MQSKHQLLKLLKIKPNNQINHFSTSKFLCTAPFSNPKPDPPESPDLPPWILNTHTKQDVDNGDDGEFVIPSLPDWVNHNNISRVIASKSPPLRSNDGDVNKLSKILARNRNYSSVDSVVEDLNGLSGVNVTEDLVLMILKRFSTNWVRAFGIFIWAKHQTGYVHTPDLYNFMVDILGKCRKFGIMWVLVEEMCKLDRYVSLITFTRIMRRLAKAGKYDEAIEAFRRMERFGISKDLEALNALMNALVKENSVEHAHTVFLEFMDGVGYNHRSFNVLVHGYCKARMLGKAREVLDEMQRCGLHPDVVSYTCFVEAYCKERDFRNVMSTLELMEEKDIKPNVITYTMVMHALGKARETNDALEIYERMKKNDCMPDSSFYSALIHLLSKRGRIKDAYDVFEDMENQGVKRDLLTYHTMITSACLHSQEEKALKLLQQMKDDSCTPDIRTYIPLLRLCYRNKRNKVLKFLLTHMFNNNVSIDSQTYGLLVDGLCRNGNLEDACIYFEEAALKGLTPRRRVYDTLVQKLEERKMIGAKLKIEMLMSQANEHEIPDQSFMHQQNSGTNSNQKLQLLYQSRKLEFRMRDY